MSDRPIVIVGAGLAGLSCARELHARNEPFVLLDAAPRVGGRVATEVVDGFRLDVGFQVLLTGYPEARRQLDYDALNLRPFRPGCLIQFGHHATRLADPWREPIAGVRCRCSRRLMSIRWTRCVWRGCVGELGAP